MKKRISIIRSFYCTLKGVYTGLNNERNIKILLSSGLMAITLASCLEISNTKWAVLIICITSILSLEFINTAIERICDFIHPHHHEQIKDIKDIAAGATLIVCLGSVIIGGIIFLPKLLSL